MTSAGLDQELSPRTHHLPAAALVVLSCGATVALTLGVGDTGRLVAVAVLQVALVAAWVVATGIRGSAGSLALGVAAAAGADAAMLLPERPELDSLLAVLGLGFLAAVVHQMTRPSPRLYLVASLAGVVLLLCSVCALAVLLALGRLDDGDRALVTAVLAVGAALLVGHLVDLVLPRPEIAAGVPRGLLGLVLAVVAAVAVALLRRDGGTLVSGLSAATYGAALGGVAALMAVGASYVVAERGQSSWALPVVQAVLPLAAAAPIAYALSLNGLG
ncbi:hypothetical protein [Modestobacter versicolor]|uniref:Uncharacterized protein n=1 Tax=Modestobacter versicolor TaxID=429133 RepID=A0A323VD71_9ACTN|nr:hypothetical protein [Modestobacter versicolor]MBB3677927.1 hypothetical protein [Modestobacter versicolor]PZA22130.1 hypothetical protein DMO24_06750 [Modestobacter versicolor]